MSYQAELRSHYNVIKDRLWPPMIHLHQPEPQPAKPEKRKPAWIPPRVWDMGPLMYQPVSPAEFTGLQSDATIDQRLRWVICRVRRHQLVGIRVADVFSAVCAAFRVSPDYLRSEFKTRDVVLPRQLGMACASILTHRSSTLIGNVFGRKDHTTVLHALRKYRAIVEEACRGLDTVPGN